MPFELEKYKVDKANEGADMFLLDPATGEKIKEGDGYVTICLLGADSKVFVRGEHEATNERLKKTVGRRGGINRNALSSEKMDENKLDLLVKCTLSWNGMGENGNVLKCEESTVRRVYEMYPWIRDQVDDFINDRKNFLGN